MKYKRPHKEQHSTESGSVLFYILIAVALFAALSYVVSQNMRGGSTSKNEEFLQLQTSEILQYANGLQRAIRHMRIEGIEYQDLSFENSFVAGYANTNCGAGQNDCKVFHPDGGGMSYQPPMEKEWLDETQSGQTTYNQWYFPRDLCVLDVGSDTGAGCNSDSKDNEDVVVILPWIKEDLCERINQDLGITSPGDSIPVESSGNAWNSDDRQFDGTNNDSERLDQGGRRYGCFEGNAFDHPGAGTYHFFQVIWAR